MTIIIRPMRAWRGEVIEITWWRTRADGKDEQLVERYTCPPNATWEARKVETAEAPEVPEVLGSDR
jgi:hypothetical protein